MVIPGNPRIGTGIDVILIPVWKRGVPVPIWGFVNPCNHTVKFLFLGQNFRWRAGAPVTQGKAKPPILITIRGIPMPEQTGGQKFPYGQSPFLKRVWDHMGSNMDMSVEKIFGDRCIRPICIYTMVARPIV
jgi:hypothetical protein